jgi:osmotically-inducible protein OsmY
MLRSHSAAPLAAILALALGGCVPVVVAGGLAAAGGAGYEAAQERGVDGSYDDYAIKTGIENTWTTTDPEMMKAFAVTVYNGDVLLTGDAPNPDLKRQAYDIASRTPGVRHIYDEIEIANLQDGWDNAQDAWITAQVRKDLVFERGVRSGNYTIETANRSVYLLGSARSQEELDKATYLARYVPGVRRVVSYVQIRSGMPFAQEQGPAPMPSGGYSGSGGGYNAGGYNGGGYNGGGNNGPSSYSPPSAPAGNSAPIQVQKL